ncbi:hypothetical protein G7Z17_g210 [Cylindrodendrum hubeiense]|uniref:Uncharacterized protein n=1 Tax=Cylindrodendrum hubeiense TaxID=595255 RepID=A0A9P5HN13_9HYPO|nr:hypothetical protein G7Z17_g210 [Cylindrodendrum hubeiense]
MKSLFLTFALLLSISTAAPVPASSPTLVPDEDGPFGHVPTAPSPFIPAAPPTLPTPAPSPPPIPGLPILPFEPARPLLSIAPFLTTPLLTPVPTPLPHLPTPGIIHDPIDHGKGPGVGGKNGNGKGKEGDVKDDKASIFNAAELGIPDTTTNGGTNANVRGGGLDEREQEQKHSD